MRGLIYSAAMLFCAAPAFAQQGGGVVQSGAVTANNCVKWLSVNIVADAGVACSGGAGITVGTTTITGGANQNGRVDPAISAKNPAMACISE